MLWRLFFHFCALAVLVMAIFASQLKAYQASNMLLMIVALIILGVDIFERVQESRSDG